ncbi:MAG: tetratricopeptide repeat protein [Vulcanimicrobiota bacterium]
MDVPARSAQRLEELKLRAQEAPKESELAVSLGEAYLREGLVEEAATQYARSTKLDPRTELKSLYWEWLGLVRESRGELEAALDAYFQWLETDPASVEPLDRLGTLLVTLQRWTDVVLLKPHYRTRVQLLDEPRVAESMALYSFVLEQLGTPLENSPLELTYAALERESESIAMRYLLGIQFYRSGHLEGARNEFERVLELDVQQTWVERRFSLMWDAATARIMLARIARLQGYPQEALARLSESFSLHDESSEGLLEVASVMLDFGHYAELLAILPTGASTALNLDRFRSECYLGLGQIELAEAGYRLVAPEAEAATPAPDELTKSQQNALEKADSLLAKGDYKGVIDRLRRVGSRKRPIWQALEYKAKAYVKLEDWNRAIKELERLVELRPDSTLAWDLLSLAYLRTDQRLRHRLAGLQREKLSSRRVPEVGLVWPAVESRNLAGLVLQARALPGKGRLVVTGDLQGRIREYAELALTVLRTEFESIGVEDPAYRDLHLHARAVWLERGPADEPEVTEDAGAAILASLGSALAGRFPDEISVVAGRLDLAGTLRGPLALEEGLSRLSAAGLSWSSILLPRACAPELLRLPPSLGVGCRLYLCDSAQELIGALLYPEEAL